MMFVRFIYFVQGEDGGPIKIGLANDVGERLKVLQTAYPFKLRVLHSEVGTGKDERTLHGRFRADRLHGEWFRASDALVAYIAGLAAIARKKPAPIVLPRPPREREKPKEAGYWGYGNPGWDRLLVASRALD